MRIPCSVFILSVLLLGTSAWAAPPSVYLESLTWTEVRDALKAGHATVIVPVGGTEQNGPHMALGKHNVRVHALAGKVAQALGNALVAPVVSYVPEGTISPASGHMRFPGTISISDDAFAGVLEGAARSFRQHGFRDIVWLGDSGNYQRLIADLAARLNREWAGTPSRVHHITAYYRTGQTDYIEALRRRGLTDAQIGTHAGAADTSLMMAVDPSLLRPGRMAPGTIAAGAAGAEGVSGDPSAASAALGEIGVSLIVARSVEAIKLATTRPDPPVRSIPSGR